MVTYSPEQIGLLIFQAGWQPKGQRIVANSGETGFRDDTPTDVKRQIIAFYDTAIAICLSESGGNPKAKNASSSASGLWQIMVSAHTAVIAASVQEATADLGLSKTPDIFHPLVNTIAAKKVSRGAVAAGKGPWQPWEVYNKGSYRKNLGHGAKVYAAMNTPEAIEKGVKKLLNEYAAGIETAQLFTDPTGAVGAASKGMELIAPILTFLRDAGITIGAFALGALLVILGIWFILSQTKAGKVIKGMTPIGRAKKLLS